MRILQSCSRLFSNAVEWLACLDPESECCDFFSFKNHQQWLKQAGGDLTDGIENSDIVNEKCVGDPEHEQPIVDEDVEQLVSVQEEEHAHHPSKRRKVSEVLLQKVAFIVVGRTWQILISKFVSVLLTRFVVQFNVDYQE